MTTARLSSAGVGLLAGLTLLVLFVLSLFVGVSDLPVGKVFSDPQSLQLLLASRLPRTLAAILAGSGLAIAGLVMQTLARNRFVEPATAGTAQCAMLGILLVSLMWPTASIASKTMAATAVAFAGTGLFLVLASRIPPTQPFLVPLFGLIFGGIVEAVVTFLAWRTDLLQMVDVWTIGELSGVLRGRYEILWVAAAMVALAWWTAERLTIISLGKDASAGLGLNHVRTMRLGLVIVAATSALTVVVVGLIPFVGLVVSAMVSRVAGDNLRVSLPWVAGGGAALVLACDIAGRLIRYPYEVPVSVIMGVVGAVVFAGVVLMRRADA